MEPWFGIPRELAKERGIPVVVWEAGVLPETLRVYEEGVCGGSEWVGKATPETGDEDLARGERYIGGWKEGLLAGSVRSVGRGGVLVLGGKDMANGVLAADGCGGMALPGYADGIDLAMKVSGMTRKEVIYRPHPDEGRLPLERLGGTNVVVEEGGEVVDAIAGADVVIGYGSKADFVAMAMDRVFIMAGRGLVSGKVCAYEAEWPDRLEVVIGEACEAGRTEEQRAGFRRLVAWMLSEGHYNRGESGPCGRGVGDLVGEVVRRANAETTGGEVNGVLSESGRAWLAEERVRRRFLGRCAMGSGGAAGVIESVGRLPKGDRAILDFDHTLFLGNSTEEFLLSVRPRWWGEVLESAGGKVWKRVGERRGGERDRWRVLAAVRGAPWSLWWWARCARGTVVKRWNEVLESAATDGRRLQPVIVSLGFRQLIEPLVRAKSGAGGGDGGPVLVCSDLYRPEVSLRRLGKVRAVEEAIPGMNWAESFVVSDSEEDRDLLMRSRKGYLVKWEEPASVVRPGYVPFRFLESGKFCGRGYLKHFILEQDLVVWMFGYGLTGGQGWAAVVLWLSLQAVYEIGYYENDYVAAKLEKEPTLFTERARFADYPMEAGGWVVGLLAGGMGAGLLGGMGGWLPFVRWGVLLLLLRAVFYVYNRQQVESRWSYYLVLQAIKNLGGAVVMTMNPAGVALAMGHAFQHSLVYLIYRCGGDKSKVPRAAMRMVVFALGLGLLAVTGVGILSVWTLVMLVWCGYQVYVERRGCRHSVLNVSMGVLVGWPKRICRRLVRVMRTAGSEVRVR
jgi:hypothetical protein